MTPVEIVRALKAWDRRLKRMRLRGLQVPEEEAGRLRPALGELAAAFEAARARWEAGRVLTLGPPVGLLREMEAALAAVAAAYARHRATLVALGVVEEAGGDGEESAPGPERPDRPGAPPQRQDSGA
ncbi:MAG: hypothetical protein L0214_01495 [candidate division NC10 bacterium]|nr:hypothetical protein [candidate division NC10 bacterium]